MTLPVSRATGQVIDPTDINAIADGVNTVTATVATHTTQIAGKLNTTDASATYPARAGGTSLAAAPLGYVNVKDFGAVGNGSTNDTAAFVAAIATGRPIYVPAANYLVRDILTLANGQVMFGDDRTTSILKVDSTFNMAALGVVRLGTGEPGAAIYDVGVSFTQADQSVRANVTAYPPAFYCQNAPRFTLDRVRISGGYDGIDARGNCGGARLGLVEVGALRFGLRIGGSSDFFHIDSYHFWPFGISSTTNLMPNVYSDGVTTALELDQCDGVDFNRISTYLGRIQILATSPFGNINTIQLDGNGARIDMASGNLTIGSVYKTSNLATDYLMNMTGGFATISSVSNVVPSSSTTSQVLVSGGELAISAGMVRLLAVAAAAFEVTSGSLTVGTVRFTNLINQVRTVPVVKQSGAGRLTISSCSVDQKGTGSGTFVQIGSDGYHSVTANQQGGWTNSIPSSGSLGIYGPNGGEQGALTFTPTVRFGTNGDFAPTYTTQNGVYWLEGNNVFFSLEVVFATNAYSTASGAFQIAGLPVTSRNAVDQPVILSRWQNVTTTGKQYVGAMVTSFSTVVDLWVSGDNIAWTRLQSPNVPASRSDIRFTVTGSYRR